MAIFTVRVEMHGADEREIYDDLHADMEAADFKRYLTFGSQKKRLPSGEYSIIGDYSIGDILRTADGIAGGVAKKHGLTKSPSVLVTKADGGRVQANLEDAEE